MKSILDKSFVYTPAAQTDLKKTFDRERKRLKDEAKIAQTIQHERILKVRNIK